MNAQLPRVAGGYSQRVFKGPQKSALKQLLSVPSACHSESAGAKGITRRP